jgi:predicted HicB family RNase H-like nuclease
MEPDEKQQFNVYLPSSLVRAVKHAAVDARQSLSSFVEDALRHQLAIQEGIRKAVKGVTVKLEPER